MILAADGAFGMDLNNGPSLTGATLLIRLWWSLTSLICEMNASRLGHRHATIYMQRCAGDIPGFGAGKI